jgi:hypothetical protein
MKSYYNVAVIGFQQSMKDRTSGGAAATASGNCIRRIKSPIYAQLHDEDLMDIQDCISGEELEAQKLSFAQWENRQLVQGDYGDVGSSQSSVIKF